MQEKELIGEELLNLIVNRLCQELIENHDDFSGSVILGLQPRGVFLAKKIQTVLEKNIGNKIPTGTLDITFFRDDFRRRENPLKANATDIPFLIEGKKVILVDDVLFTGRTVRAALDAMSAYGRPEKVELLVLIDRKYTRELPVHANYVGQTINSMLSQKVIVELTESGEFAGDCVKLISVD